MINVKKNCILIRSCRVTILMNAKQRGRFFQKNLFLSNRNVVLPHSKTMIFFVLIFLLNDCNLIFYSTICANLILYAHIVNHTKTKILVSNNFNCPLYIAQYQKLNYIINICYDYYVLTKFQTTFYSAVFLFIAQLFINLHARVELTPINALIKT